MMVTADDDVVARRGDVLLPPRRGFAGHRAGRRTAAEFLASDRVRQVVAIAHHEEADIADLEGVTLPGSLDGIRAPRRVDTRSRGIFPHRVDPLPKPPVRRLSCAALSGSRRGVVIARHRVDLLAPVLAQRAELPHNREALLVIRQIPQPGIVAEVQGNIPMERRTAELASALRLPERRGQTLGVTGRRRERHAIAYRVGKGFVGRHMGVREDPQMEGLRLAIAAGCRLHVRHVLLPLAFVRLSIWWCRPSHRLRFLAGRRREWNEWNRRWRLPTRLASLEEL